MRQKQANQKRQSNLELFRIVSMLLIVAHHYVVNSGLLAADGPVYTDIFSNRAAFVFVFGAFGKTGINCFLLITGYFMCKSDITLVKYLKLYGEIVFYRTVIGFIFIFAGYQDFSLLQMLKWIMPFNKIEDNFTGCFMAFYLLIPFLNILIRNMTERQHIYLMTLLLIIYSGLATLNAGFGFSVTMNYFTWFAVLYFIASYIRLYPKDLFFKTRVWGIAMCISFGLSALSILFCRWFNYKFMDLTNGGLSPYYFVADSNKILAVLTAVCSFLFFFNINIKYHSWINALGASTFGVFLIHANSSAMRKWLWKDLLDNVGAYSLGVWMPIHAIASVLGVYIVCSGLDLLRIKFIETPVLKLVDKKQEVWKRKYKDIEKTICQKLHIQL